MAGLIDARSLLLGAVCGAAVLAVWMWLRASLLCVWLPRALAPGQLGSDYVAAGLVLLLGWPTGVMLRDAVGLRSGLYVLLALLLIPSLVLGFTDIRAPHPQLGVWFKLTMGWLGVASLSLVSGATQITHIEAPEPAAGAWRWVALCLLMLLPLGTALIMLRPVSRAWLSLEPHAAQPPCATGEASTGRSVADADGNDRAEPSEPPQIGEPAPAAVPRPPRSSFIDRLFGSAVAGSGIDAPGSQASFFGDFMGGRQGGGRQRAARGGVLCASEGNFCLGGTKGSPSVPNFPLKTSHCDHASSAARHTLFRNSSSVWPPRRSSRMRAFRTAFCRPRAPTHYHWRGRVGSHISVDLTLSRSRPQRRRRPRGFPCLARGRASPSWPATRAWPGSSSAPPT